MTERKLYLDHIRWSTVLLVMFYHVCYLFNDVGILGGIPGAKNIPLCDTLASAAYPWFMVLLFAVSGISARYSLQSRTARQFVRERARKLLIPSTLGLFVLHWLTGYLNIKLGGGLEYIPAPLVYPIAAVSGTGPLWFIQMLFLFSCVLLLFRKLDRGDRLWTVCGRTPLPVILLLFLVLWGGAQVLNLPVLTMYRFGIYLAAFLIGYLFLSHDAIQEAIKKLRIPLLIAAVLGAVGFGYYYRGTNFTSPDCLQSFFTNLYAWLAVLAILGCFKRYFNRETSFTRYMTTSSFGFYILHYPILMGSAYLLCTYTDLPAGWNYLLILLAQLVLTPALYEAVRRIPVVRYLVLGMKKQ